MIRKLIPLLLLGWSLPLLAAPPRVVVSIAPIHSLVAGVTEGVSEPRLLIPATASPHAYALKPSDARALSRAGLVVWIGEGLESMLEKPLQALPDGARVLEVAALDGIHLLPGRKGGIWQAEAHHDHDHGHGHGHGEMDGHLWLDPDNARVIVSAVAATLAELDAGHAERYRANASAMLARIDELERELRAQLAPVKEVPYIVFHDAYRYFEQAFGLHPAGAITVSPERAPGARRLSEIRDAIRRQGAVCVFSEPQFRPATVSVVLEGSGARHGVLDPLGAELQPGAGLWFELMRALAENLRLCLQPG